jgi:hypothetical protein
MGSHNCGAGCSGKSPTNAGRHNIFCIIREPLSDNNNRQPCHALSIDEPDAESKCFLGITHPYSTGRSYRNHKVMRQRFVGHYKSVINEGDLNGKRANRLGKCPTCNYEAVVAGCGLSVLLDSKTVNKFVDQMRLRHGIEMGRRFSGDPTAEYLEQHLNGKHMYLHAMSTDSSTHQRA